MGYLFHDAILVMIVKNNKKKKTFREIIFSYFKWKKNLINQNLPLSVAVDNDNDEVVAVDDADVDVDVVDYYYRH